LGIILAVHIPVVVVRIINANNVFKSFGLTLSQLLSVRLNDIRNVFRDGLSFVSGGPIANFLCHPLSIILVGVYSESLVTASFAAVISAIILAASFFSLVISPFRGALPEARRRGDYGWIRRMYWLTLFANLTYALVPFVLLTFFGQSLFEFWYQGSVSPNHLILVASGLYILCLAVEVTNYNFLSSLGHLQSASRWLLFKSLTTAAAVWFLALSENPEYIFFAMFFLTCFFSVLPLSVLALTIFKRDSNQTSSE
jgi:O-antigen/teichoic acid export membrane protein